MFVTVIRRGQPSPSGVVLQFLSDAIEGPVAVVAWGREMRVESLAALEIEKVSADYPMGYLEPDDADAG